MANRFPQYQIPGGIAKGMTTQGNIDITKRIGDLGDPHTWNPLDEQGYAYPSESTVYSGNFTDSDGRDVVVPFVIPSEKGGYKIATEKEAIKYYQKTGEHLGKFTNPTDASNYAESLHEYLASQAAMPDETGKMVPSLPATQNLTNMLGNQNPPHVSPPNTRNGLFTHPSTEQVNPMPGSLSALIKTLIDGAIQGKVK